MCPQGSGLGTVNGAENTAGTDIYKDFAFVSVLLLNSLTYVDWTTQRQVASLLCVLWDEVVVCIVLGSHQIWEITIQPTVFLTATETITSIVLPLQVFGHNFVPVLLLSTGLVLNILSFFYYFLDYR